VRFYFASLKVLKRASELASRHGLDGAAEFLHYNSVLEHRR
jgi:hypothetical protein